MTTLRHPLWSIKPLAGLITIVVMTIPAIATCQSLLDRPPNVSGDWVGAPGSLYFHFIHRFSTSAAPERKVTNVPTFLVGSGFPHHLFAGMNYSTNSTLAPNFPNEWEIFARYAPLSQDVGAPFDLGGQIGYNNAAQGVDGEVSIGRRMGTVRMIAAARALSDPLIAGHQRFAMAGGATVRLGNFAALSGDVSSLTSRDSSERLAWSAGLHLAIPLTPHTLSIQVTNTLVGTLQGLSRGTIRRRYGFEFTIPLTLSRYFGKRETQSPEADSTISGDAAPMTASAVTASEPERENSTVAVPGPAAQAMPAPPAARDPNSRPSAAAKAVPPSTGGPIAKAKPPARALPGSGKIVQNGMKNINYLRQRLEIEAGTTVVWTNADPLAHTVTSEDKTFNSGLVYPGKTFRHTFNKPGTYHVFCLPHPFMKGVIVVKQ